MGYKDDYVAGSYYHKDNKENEFALIVVLFILLIIVGTHFMKKDSYY